MNCFRHERKILPAIAFAALLVVTAVFSSALYFCLKLKVETVARTVFIALIVTVVVCLLVIGLCIYSVITYRRIQRIFLMAVVITFTIVIGSLAFIVFTYRDVLYEFVATLWTLEDRSAAEMLEEYFGCKGWNPDTNVESCASVIQNFLNKEAHKVGLGLGILFLIFMLGMFFCFYLLCNKGKLSECKGDEEERDLPAMGGNGLELDDIHEQLNPSPDFADPVEEPQE